jgi:hypothetical protein
LVGYNQSHFKIFFHARKVRTGDRKNSNKQKSFGIFQFHSHFFSRNNLPAFIIALSLPPAFEKTVALLKKMIAW